MNWAEISEQINENEKQNPTMDINSEPGTKVIFKYPDNGRKYDSELACKELLYRGVYTVKRIDVGGFCSYVELIEKPGIEFNTVHFANYKEEK